MIKIGHLIGFWISDSPWLSRRVSSRSGTMARYRSLDLLISVLIIGILSVIAIKIFTVYKHQAILLHSFGEANTLMKQDQVYFSLTGMWPEGKDRLEQVTGWPCQEIKTEYNSYVTSCDLDHGAVTVTFAKDLEGKTLTLRPAVPKEDPLGPVIWVAGQGLQREDWTLAGEDKTTVDPRVINRSFK